MRASSPYLLYQIARFGSLTIREVRALCEGMYARTDIYAALKALREAKLIVRLAHPNVDSPVYQPTPDGVKSTLGETQDRTRPARVSDMVHSLRVAQTLIALSRYENVTGFASEFEVPLEQWQQFSRTKVPDGVIQVTRGDLIYELAVEIEVTPKTWARSEDFLFKYEDAFAHQAGCSGVILVCDEEDIFNRYQTLLKKKGEQLSKRFLIIRGPSVPPLNPNLYGEPRKIAGFCANQRRTSFSDGIRYLPMKFTSREFCATQLTPDKDPLSGKIKNEDKLQTTSH